MVLTTPAISSDSATQKSRLWFPDQVLFTPAALDEPWGQKILEKVRSLNLPIEELPRNRLTGLRGEDEISSTLDFDCDLTFELITHRFTPGSKDVLTQWYPHSKLDMDESTRSMKRNKFGGIKYVYDADTMKSLRSFFAREIAQRFPEAKILYWT